ncbi:DUF4271 domain-containing protein [Chryseobacterium sp. SNU WT5]|nr:DUF4271 domain-containing protein [Chryseobacterium sp. SNU WT5]
MITFAKIILLVRIVQQNDWVVFIIIGCILLYIFMLLYLQRDSSVKVFLSQKFADSSNNFLSWIIISAVLCLLFATLISPSIPVVPRKIANIHFFGYELNKFGFSLLSLGAFYALKSVLSYLLFAGTGGLRRWSMLRFVASKFYFVLSFLLFPLCIYQYYFVVNPVSLFQYFPTGVLFILVFKIFVYLMTPIKILPEKWYYKILYLCTLQIAPILLLWRVLYF